MRLLLSCSLILVALTSIGWNVISTDQPAATETYATVAFSSAGKNIYVYYGGDQKEEIPLDKKESINNKILDVLHKLNADGYELVSTSSHAFNRSDVSTSVGTTIRTTNINYIELYYTLRKRL